MANKDNALYLLHFPTYIQVLLDTVAPSRIAHDRIVPAFLFTSSSRALQVIQPLLFTFFQQFGIAIDYACYLAHLVNSGHTGTHPRTWQALKRSPQTAISWSADLATAMALVLQELLHRPWRPCLHCFNQHEQWLQKRKPAKLVAIGSPQLSTRFYGCGRGWPRFDYDRVHPYHKFSSSTSKQACRGRLWDEGHRCILLLKAVIFFLRKAAFTTELVRLSRKALPRHVLWFPGLMKKARTEMDAYVFRWEGTYFFCPSS